MRTDAEDCCKAAPAPNACLPSSISHARCLPNLSLFCHVNKS